MLLAYKSYAGLGCSSVVEQLPSMCKTLGRSLSTATQQTTNNKNPQKNSTSVNVSTDRDVLGASSLQ
jgi:hypothetical protein